MTADTTRLRMARAACSDAEALEAKAYSDVDRIKLRLSEATDELARLDAHEGASDVDDLLGGRDISPVDPESQEQRRKASATVSGASRAMPRALEQVEAARQNRESLARAAGDELFALVEQEKANVRGKVLAILTNIAPWIARLYALDNLQLQLLGGVFTLPQGAPVPRIWSGSAMARRLVDSLAPHMKPAELEDTTLRATISKEEAAIQAWIQETTK